MSLSILSLEDLRFGEALLPRIAINAWSNAARTVVIQGFTREGLIDFRHATNADRSASSENFRIPGVPIGLWASVVSADLPVRRGALYVQLSLQFGGFTVALLISGYFEDSGPLSYPPAKLEGFAAGRGLIRSVLGTNPAAGSEVSESVPTNALWKLISMQVPLVTDATGTPQVNMVIDDGATVLFRQPAVDVQAVSVTRNYTFSPHVGMGVQTGLEDTSFGIGAPTFPLLFQGYRIRTLTTGLDAADDFGAPQMWVEEWIQE